MNRPNFKNSAASWGCLLRYAFTHYDMYLTTTPATRLNVVTYAHGGVVTCIAASCVQILTLIPDWPPYLLVYAPIMFDSYADNRQPHLADI